MAKYKVLLGDTMFPKEFPGREGVLAKAAEWGLDVEVVEATENTEDQLIALGADADAVIIMRNLVTRRVAENLKKCKLVIKPAIGLDPIDIPACTKHGIPVANVPTYCIGEVADHTMALLLSVIRYIPNRNSAIKGGAWRIADPYIPRLSETVLGILGFGRIAKAVAERAKPFVKEVWAYDPYLPDSAFEQAGVKRITDLSEMWSNVDELSINLPLTNETRGMINAEILSQMKPTAVIVNTGRGPIINESDLCDAIENGTILGAGLDVFEIEPLPADSRLRSLDRVVLTSHQASYSDRSIPQLMDSCLEEVMQALSGQPIEGQVNRRELSQLRCHIGLEKSIIYHTIKGGPVSNVSTV